MCTINCAAWSGKPAGPASLASSNGQYRTTLNRRLSTYQLGPVRRDIFNDKFVFSLPGMLLVRWRLVICFATVYFSRFILLMIPERRIISGSTGTIFTKFSPNGRHLIVDGRFDLLFPIGQVTKAKHVARPASITSGLRSGFSTAN